MDDGRPKFDQGQSIENIGDLAVYRNGINFFGSVISMDSNSA